MTPSLDRPGKDRAWYHGCVKAVCIWLWAPRSRPGAILPHAKTYADASPTIAMMGSTAALQASPDVEGTVKVLLCLTGHVHGASLACPSADSIVSLAAVDSALMYSCIGGTFILDEVRQWLFRVHGTRLRDIRAHGGAVGATNMLLYLCEVEIALGF